MEHLFIPLSLTAGDLLNVQAGAKSPLSFGGSPASLMVYVPDSDAAVATLEKPAPGTYEVAGLSKQPHSVRIEALTESQAGANVFGGFFLPFTAGA